MGFVLKNRFFSSLLSVETAPPWTLLTFPSSSRISRSLRIVATDTFKFLRNLQHAPPHSHELKSVFFSPLGSQIWVGFTNHNDRFRLILIVFERNATFDCERMAD